MEIVQSKLYDRQIQIFGTDTQKVISSTEVFIFGISTITTEVAKNLALIGFKIAIQEDKLLTLEDIKNSPLLGACDETSVGRSISQVIAEKLLEMNPHTQVRIVTEPIETAFNDNTKIFVSINQSFESQLSISLKLKHINIAKFYLFHNSYRFAAIAELPNNAFCLSDYSAEQLKTKLHAEFDIDFEFDTSHTASMDDFIMQCIYGATFNQTLLTLVSHKRLVYNLLYADADSQSDNPNHHRRLECFNIK